MHAVKLCLLPCLPTWPSSHPGDGAFLYWAWRLYDFHSGFGHFHCLLALGILSRWNAVVIRQWQFQIAPCSIIGAFGVILVSGDANSHDQHVALPGLFMPLPATFCWALYGVLIKRPSAELGSIRSFGVVVSFITFGVLFPLTLAFARSETPFQAGVQGEPGSDHLGR